MGCFEDLHAVYDFHKFTRAFLPKSADRHIKRQFVIARDGRVFVHTKEACSMKIAWSDWVQMYPSTFAGYETYVAPSPSTSPEAYPNKAWDDFEAAHPTES